MKTYPLMRQTPGSQIPPRPGNSPVAQAQGVPSFANLFLSAVTQSKIHQPPLPHATLVPSPGTAMLMPTQAPSVQGAPPLLEAETTSAQASTPVASPSPAALQEGAGTHSSSASSPQMEMFPLSGPTTVPPGYVPALIADLSVNSETGEATVRLTPTTTTSQYTMLYLMKGVPVSSLLQHIRWQAEDLGISLDDTPLTVESTDLPPPFAGKSLEELNQMVLPEEFFYINPNGPYGSINGQLPVTPDQRSTAFALVGDYVIDLETSAA